MNRAASRAIDEDLAIILMAPSASALLLIMSVFPHQLLLLLPGGVLQLLGVLKFLYGVLWGRF